MGGQRSSEAVELAEMAVGEYAAGGEEEVSGMEGG